MNARLNFILITSIKSFINYVNLRSYRLKCGYRTFIVAVAITLQFITSKITYVKMLYFILLAFVETLLWVRPKSNVHKQSLENCVPLCICTNSKLIQTWSPISFHRREVLTVSADTKLSQLEQTWGSFRLTKREALTATTDVKLSQLPLTHCSSLHQR